MHKNAALLRALCLPYCRYYKAGVKEELVCRGAVIVERLMRAGRKLDGPAPGSGHRPEAGDERLASRLCSRCDFREQDCDFAEDRESQPCGGFVLLAGLLQRQAILLEDIEAAGTE